MREVLLHVPTYTDELDIPSAQVSASDHQTADRLAVRRAPGYGAPEVPVLIQDVNGVRVVLGTHDSNAMEYPHVHIERRPNGWAVFLHPSGDSDPIGFVAILDDLRTVFAKEAGLDSEVQICAAQQAALELDGCLRANSSLAEIAAGHAEHAANAARPVR